MDCHNEILNPTMDENLESLCKLELIDLLNEKRHHCTAIEQDNHNLQAEIEKLEIGLTEQLQKCQRLEEDKLFLRSNIKKASALWFERKAKLSECDIDSTTEEIEEKDSEDNKELERKLLHDGEGAHMLITEEAIKLFLELKFKNEQLELSEMQINELTKRGKDYEKVIDDQEIIIHGLERQLDTYFNDNQTMSRQLTDLHKLFKDIEAINEKQVKTPEPIEENDTSKDYLPTEEDFKDMKGSVSKTYMKLKELIYEKKSLVTEIERLQTLNVELQHRVSQQENRLVNVSDALQNTWLLVSDLKDQHAKIHTSESILRYELREKREILHKLREELESAREQWHIIRQKNSESEQAWTSLRAELNERRILAQSEQSLTPEEVEGAVGGTKAVEKEFEPPIDLLVDMGIEYGVIDADDEEPTTAVALIGGEDVQTDRLQNLEEQCCHLYQKLMSSTARALNLASRLTSLHDQYANEDEEGEDNEDDEDEEDEEYLEGEDNIFGTELMSPDSESYDTAYVSEVDSNSGPPTEVSTPLAVTIGTNPMLMEGIISEEQPNDDNYDALSRRLITFLPRKIEILSFENKKLEDRLAQLQEEKLKIENTYSTSLEFEVRQKKDLEKQLSQLGKCVDELKLERNGKIAALEQELRKKVEEVKKEEEEEYLNLQEKFEQRGELLRLTAEQLQFAQDKVTKAEETEQKLQETIYELNLELETLKETTQRNIQQNKTDLYNDRTNLIGVLSEVPPQINDDQCCLQSTPYEMDFSYLTILTKDILRISFLLDKGTTFCWSIKLHSEQITFSIHFEEDCSTTTLTESLHSELRDILEVQSNFVSNKNISISKELLEPFDFFHANGTVEGKICPKIRGNYVIIFKNSTHTSQDISFKTWKQTSLEDDLRK